MKEQEFNNLITQVSNSLAPINQLLFEILVIISIYIYLERIQSNTSSLSFLSDNSNSFSVIIIFTILALGVDFYIWNNPVQTILFGAILFIYIRYKMSNMQLISSFVNMTGEHANAAALALSSADELMRIECQKPRIPEMIDLPYNTTDIKPFGIMAYDKTEKSINSINDAYKSDSQPPATITDSNYARVMLNELYQTTQYQNNHPPNEIDSSLANDILPTIKTNSQNSYSQGQGQGQGQSAPAISDEELLDSFRHPKRQFLDSQWLSNPGIGTYNDNTLCKVSSSRCRQQGNQQSQDAICNIVKFGKKLEQCTNQEYTVSINQLDKISNNAIPYDEF